MTPRSILSARNTPVPGTEDNFGGGDVNNDLDLGIGMDLDQPPGAPVPWGANAGPPAPVPVKSRQKKNVRLLLDPRTELTNDELRNARDNYVADQMRLRREAERERAKKDAAEQARSLIFAPPSMRKCLILPLSHLGLMVVIQLKLNP